MKNKLLVSVFAMAMAAFALTSCETKSNVTDVCSDLVKGSMHKFARSLQQQDGESLTISEYEFLGGVNDNRMVYRTIMFGNGTFKAKQVDSLTYEYGEWNEDFTSHSLLVTPRTGDPYTLYYRANAFIAPDGRVFGGEVNNTARVEKWEKALATFPASGDWEGVFRSEFVLDSVFEDSIYTNPITLEDVVIKVFKGKMDTLSADTTCKIWFTVNRDPNTLINTGHYKIHTMRTKYNRETKEETVVREAVKEYNCNWFFSDVSTDAKFSITMKSTGANADIDVLNISKYKLDDSGKPAELQCNGVACTPTPAP